MLAARGYTSVLPELNSTNKTIFRTNNFSSALSDVYY